MRLFIASLALALAGHAQTETLVPEWIKVAAKGATYDLVPKLVVDCGGAGKFLRRTLQDIFTCNHDVFGDPVFGTAKTWDAEPTGCVPSKGQAPAVGTKLAGQDKSLQVGAPTRVSYVRAITTGGQSQRDSAPVEKVVNGAGVCSSEFFGKNPAVESANKGPSYRPATAEPTVTQQLVPPVLTAASDIVDRTGAVVPSAYAAMAYRFNSGAGVIYKFGAPASKSGVQTLPERADVGALDHGGGVNLSYYQLGRADDTNNMYVTINAAVIGLPVSGQSVTTSVAWVQNSATDQRTFQQRPQLMWQDRRLLPPSVDDYIAQGVLAANDPADLPVAEHRGENAADSPATRQSLVATQGSPTKTAKMFTIGTYTAQNRASTSFKLGFVPTSIAVTGGGEFALVSGWDVQNTKGQVAVVSLGSAPQGWKPGQARYDWWHGWMDMMHPGFVDQGNYVFMKVVGYVDLPTDMRAPTAIAATTGIHPYTTMLKYKPDSDEINSFMMMNSPMAANRAKMLPGGEDYERYAKGGIAVVVSKSEKRVAFIDLGPLFAYTNGMYLGSAASNRETQNVGLAASQWPYPLADKPKAMPIVVKTLTLPSRPTAVWTTATRSYWSKDEQQRIEAHPFWKTVPQYSRAAIATESGDLLLYSLGRYAAGPKPTSPAPSDIQKVGAVTGLGSNITHLAAAKDFQDIADPINDLILFTDRANRRWGWVRIVNAGDRAATGHIVRTMQDSRVDPIMVTMADNYSTKGYVLTVADYSGASIANYRFGDVVYPDAGSGFCTKVGACPTLSPLGEFAGRLALPFRPTAVHSSNVP